MKLNRLLFQLVPKGSVKEEMKSLYYRYYYNRKHFQENNFYIYYKDGYFEYEFPKGVKFKCYTNVEDELRWSLWGYIKEHTLKIGETVIDCGAGVGDFTFFAAKIVGTTGRVIAFEPDPIIYDKLKTGVELNKLVNVTLVKKGVWSKNTTLKFMSANGKPRSHIFDKDDVGVIEIPVVSLDDEFKKMGIDKIDFMKMDVEGAEVEAIKGATQILTNMKVDLAIASYHNLNGEKSCFKLEKILSSMGYRVETKYPKHLTTHATRDIHCHSRDTTSSFRQ